MRTLILIPSFWGSVSWIIAYTLYVFRLISWEPASPVALFLFFVVACWFLGSTLIFYPFYAPVSRDLRAISPSTGGATFIHGRQDLLVVMMLHVLGFLGFAMYIKNLIASFGGLRGVLNLFLGVGQTHLIRGANMQQDFAGLELTYLGWIAIFATVPLVMWGGYSRGWLLVAAAQFMMNLLLVDRTRPFWIIFVVAVLALACSSHRSPGLIVRRGMMMAVGLLMLFVAYGYWSGRNTQVSKYGDTILPLWAQDLYVYITSGFAYFNREFLQNQPLPGLPDNVFYAEFRVMSLFGIVENPPSEVLQFLQLPFSTNVGTFLLPWLHDGGIIYVAIGLVIHTMGFNLLAIGLLKSNRLMAMVLWANLCLITVMGFFVPKIGTTAFLVIVVIAVVSRLLNLGRFKPNEADPSCPMDKKMDKTRNHAMTPVLPGESSPTTTQGAKI